MKPLDAHIRSANPYAAGWTAALMCYPPFLLMDDGGPLDYHPGTADWSDWLAMYPSLTVILGIVLVALTAFYAWATVAFGLRFSNLTHRGILTHGPYAWSKHPAYLSKNVFWWLSTLPFLATTGSRPMRCATPRCWPWSAASITGARAPRSGIWAPIRPIGTMPPGWSATAPCPAPSAA